MILLIECIITCIVFTIMVVPPMKKNPLAYSYDYPPKIQTRLKELKLVESDRLIVTKPVILKKLLISLVTAVLLSIILYFFNGADNFISGFFNSMIIWLSVTWFDALVLDCIWFCHNKNIRIKGTEDMISEYHNYGYHLLASCKGTLIGLPVCAIVGGLTTLLGIIV